jgi:hypothetical protein
LNIGDYWEEVEFAIRGLRGMEKDAEAGRPQCIVGLEVNVTGFNIATDQKAHNSATS